MVKLPRHQLLAQMGAALLRFAVAHGHRVGGGLADEEHLLPSAGQGGVEQVALQHHEVRLEQRDDHDRILAALALVDADAVGEGDVAEIAALEARAARRQSRP